MAIRLYGHFFAEIELVNHPVLFYTSNSTAT